MPKTGYGVDFHRFVGSCFVYTTRNTLYITIILDIEVF